MFRHFGFDRLRELGENLEGLDAHIAADVHDAFEENVEKARDALVCGGSVGIVGVAVVRELDDDGAKDLDKSLSDRICLSIVEKLKWEKLDRSNYLRVQLILQSIELLVYKAGASFSVLCQELGKRSW